MSRDGAQPGFTTPGVWDGGHYQVYVWWHGIDAERLERAHGRLWSHATLDGYFTDRDREPGEQERFDSHTLALDLTDDHTGYTLFGVASLAGARLPCQSASMRFLGEPWERPVQEEVESALCLSLPMGALTHLFEVGAFPFDDGRDSLAWRGDIDGWLAQLARWAYQSEPFDAAIVGFEVDVDAPATLLREGVPDERWDGCLLPSGDELVWHPPTVQDAPFSFAPQPAEPRPSRWRRRWRRSR